MMVHVYGKVRLLPDGETRAFLSRLVQAHEVNTTYRLEALPPDFVDKELKGVVGFAVEVTRLDAGYKLSQNRNAEDHANIVRELDQRGDANSAAVAQAMRAQRGHDVTSPLNPEPGQP
jgi:transcriptional regulator